MEHAKRALVSLTLVAATLVATAGFAGATPQAFRGDPALRIVECALLQQRHH